MPLKINSSGGGSVSINAPVTGSNFSLTVPANNATLITSDGGAITGNVAISGNLSVSGNNINPSTPGMRNRIINGAMMIDQRNAGASVTPASNSLYNLDRWMISISQGSKFSIQQNAGSVNPPAGFKNYLGCTSLSSYTVGVGENFAIDQAIEGYNVADLGWGTASAQTVTLSFWVRSSLTGTFGGCLFNATQDRSYTFSYTISSANTWTYVSITIPGDTTGTWNTSNGVGVYIFLTIGAGSNVCKAAGSWGSGYYVSVPGATSIVGTNTATWYVTGVQLEAGTQATPFEFRHYGQELALCQRYYERLISLSNSSYLNGAITGTNQFRGDVRFAVTKRAAPTFGSSSYSTFLIQGNNGNANPTAISLVGSSLNSAYISVSVTSTLGTGVVLLDANSNSYLEFIAEL